MLPSRSARSRAASATTIAPTDVTHARHPVLPSRSAVALATAAALAFGCGRQRVEPAPAPEPVAAAPEPAPPPVRPAPPRALNSIVDTIFALTNRERVRADLTPLRRSAQLTRAAQIQADQMAAAGKLAHELPGSRYPTMTSRLRAVGYTPKAAGENIAEGYTSGAALLAGWMTSPAHKANILSAKYTETGVGTARSKSGRTYHAQLFAQPR
jgi:uncharacterized protein YkwD